MARSLRTSPETRTFTAQKKEVSELAVQVLPTSLSLAVVALFIEEEPGEYDVTYYNTEAEAVAQRKVRGWDGTQKKLNVKEHGYIEHKTINLDVVNGKVKLHTPFNSHFAQ